MADDTVLEQQQDAPEDVAPAPEAEAPAVEAPVGENHASLDAALAAQQGAVTTPGEAKPAATAPEPGTPGYITGAAPAAPAAPWAADLGTAGPRPGWPGPPPATPAPAPDPQPQPVP
jgi:hypothetical protein